MERSSSPTPSARNLIRSYTTSSDESAAERIAAARAARERRRLERERDTAMRVDDDRDEYSRQATLPRVEVHEADSQDGRSPLGGAGEDGDEDDSAGSSSLVPKLRVQPTSDRSYTPSVPSTPSRSLPSSSPDAAATVPLPAHDPLVATPSSDPVAPSAASSPRRQSFEVADIPPFRPKSASPVGSPSSASPAATPPHGSAPRPSSPAHVALAGGLMERLKARRAANLATAAAQGLPLPPASAPPPASSEAGSSAAYTPFSEVLPLPHESGTPPTSPSQEPVALESPDPAAEGQPPSWPVSTQASKSTSGPSLQQDAYESVRTARNTVSSKVYGRDGAEVDFDFHQLSDVPEQTERSTLSNWRESVPQHRRRGSISSTGRPASSTFSAPVPAFNTQPKRFSLTSSVSSLGLQQVDGSFARPTRSRPAIPGPSTWSALPTASEVATPPSEVSTSSSQAPDHRIDATSRLLGRGCSTASIFPASSASSGVSSNFASSTHSAAESRPSSPPARNPSPTRRVSPEVARRAAQFAQASAPPRSPVKSSSTSSLPQLGRFPDRQPLPLLPSSLEPSTTFTTSHSLPQLPTPAVDEEDPLVIIERKRLERRRAIDAFRAQLAQDQQPPRSENSTPRAAVESRSATPSSHRRWASSDVTAPSAPLDGAHQGRSPSPGGAILCEGYLFTPPDDDTSVAARLDHERWSRRYCVLTSSGLEFRPTDREPGIRPSRTFDLTECALVDDDAEAELAGGLKPFAVLLKNGQTQHFACESRAERVKWVAALQNAIIASTRDRLRSAAHAPDGPSSPIAPGLPRPESTRTLTPPGSRFSSTRGTVRSWGEQAKDGEGTSSPPPWSPQGLGLYSFADDKRRPLAPRTASTLSSSSTISSNSYLPEKATADRKQYDRDLFGMYSARPPHPSAQVAAARPSSEQSVRSDRSLPPLPPPKDALGGHATSGHRHAQSELSSYSTPVDQSPIRPTPTRPNTSTTLGTSSMPSSPNKRFEPPSNSTSSYVSPDEVAALERELRDLGDKVETAAFPKIKRDERYRRVQERLQTLQRRLTSAPTPPSLSTPSIGKAREQDLAEKVDYLLHVTQTLLDKPVQRDTSTRGEEVLMSRVEARIRDLLKDMEKPAHLAPPSSPSTIRACAQPDNATVTTRAGIHSPSEHFEWQRDLERFKNEATVSCPPTASSVASPNTVLRERERASRKLQNLSPLSPNDLEPFESAGSYFGALGGGGPTRPRDPFAGSGVVEPTREFDAPRHALQPAHEHPFTQSAVRTQAPWGGGASSVTRSAISWAESDVGKVEQTLFRILEGFERQNGSLAENQHHQERVAQVIGELAKWVAEDRSLRDAQFHELIGAVRGVVEHVAELPQRMLASFGAAEAAQSGHAAQLTVDRSGAELDDDAQLDDAAHGVGGADAAHGEVDGSSGMPKESRLGLNPLSSFAQLDRKIAAGETSGTAGRIKGPRMPGIRLWGAPEPVTDRVNRWGGRGVAAKASEDTHAADEALSGEVDAAHGPNRPVVDALKNDEQLGHALQAIADGSGDEVDAGVVSLAVFEILQTLRDLSKKQVEQEAREKAEREKHGGLTLKEKAELEAKRAEIARLERETVMNSERTAKINEMVAALAAKTEKADSLLAQIAKNVQEGKTTTMDPALSDEVKRLLGGVRTGVDEHVKDFRGQLTSEVQRMFKEVGRLRDEKKALQTDIAELMAFAAKQGGGSATKPTIHSGAAAAPEPSKPAVAAAGLPSSGFFGPRAMK